jgi:hypothetical protein
MPEISGYFNPEVLGAVVTGVTELDHDTKDINHHGKCSISPPFLPSGEMYANIS